MGQIPWETIEQERMLPEARKARLIALQEARCTQPILDFIREFGVFDLGELDEGQTLAFIAARNLMMAVDLLEIPQGKDPRGADAHLAYDVRRPKTTLGMGVRPYLEAVPSEEQDLDSLTGPEDIPFAVSEDLLLRRRAPKEFLRRLTEGSLLRIGWLQTEQDPTRSRAVEDPATAADATQSAAADEQGSFGYLLLDASESMGTGRDDRNVVARGLALAYLRSQILAHNPSRMFLFRQQLSQGYEVRGLPDLPPAVAKVLRHGHYGMTNLQDTLGELAEQMTKASRRADVILITDGITRLHESPLGSAHLHTFLLGDQPEELDGFGSEQYQSSLKKLRDWSDFFLKIGPAAMREVLIPTRSDLLSLRNYVFISQGELAARITDRKRDRILRRLQNIQGLVDRFKQRHSLDAELREFEASLAAARAATAPAGLQVAELGEATPRDQELALMLEASELRSILQGESVTTGDGWSEDAARTATWKELWLALRAWFRGLRYR